MFLPFLLALADGNPRHTRDVAAFIEKHFKLSDADRQELIPSGQSTKVANRVGWVRTYFKKAGLISPEARAIYKITDEGRKVLANPPAAFDLRFLDTIPAYHEWIHASRRTESDPAVSAKDQTPEEQLTDIIDDFKIKLIDEIQTVLATINPFRFEQIVLDLLSAMGYGGSRAEAARVTRQMNDEGIDGIINEDRLGLDTIYIQAKRWQGNVGRPEVQSFVGAIAGKQAHKGVFITTSSFTSGAFDYAQTVPQKVVLIDGDRLAELMIEHNIGVSIAETIYIKRIDSDYFDEA
ncbi:MAG: restriction endonuclease [Chthoniobacterales bacterium]